LDGIEAAGELAAGMPWAPVSPVAPVAPVAPVEPVAPAGPGVTTTGVGGFTFTGLSQAESAKDATKTEVSARWFMVFPLK
jgi:hypothetical protein